MLQGGLVAFFAELGEEDAIEHGIAEEAAGDAELFGFRAYGDAHGRLRVFNYGEDDPGDGRAVGNGGNGYSFETRQSRRPRFVGR